MTRIIDGYAQPDIHAIGEGGKQKFVFVEDALSLLENEEALLASIREIIRTRLSTIAEIRLVVIE